MAKKLLAVILAVTIALSAMAISVFADYEIPLFKNQQAWKDKTYDTSTVQLTLDIPVYGMYGYLTAGDYMIVNLPTDWGGNCNDETVSWTVQVMGQNYDLPTIKNACSWNPQSTNVTPVKIVLGYFGHHYDGKDTAIPQTVGYNTITSIRLIAQFEVDADWRVPTNLFDRNTNPLDGWVGIYRTSVNAQWYKEDGTPVTSSITYAYDWAINKAADNATKDNTYDFVNEEWTDPNKNLSVLPFTWDHTLEARQNAMDAYNNNYTVELHVPLTDTLNGIATYTLWANSGDATYANGYGYWWQYENKRVFVDKQTIDGPTDELVFNVPSNILYEGKYGTFNTEFVIFEDIMLLNNTVMKNYLYVDRAKVGGDAGSLGDLSWAGQYDGDIANRNRVRYKGALVNYASTGKAGTGSVIGKVPYPDPESTADVTIPAGSAWTAVKTGLEVKEGQTAVITIKKAGESFPYQYGFNVGSQIFEGVDGTYADAAANHPQVKATYAELVEKGYKGGDFEVYGNSWSGHEFDELVLTVSVYDDAKLGAAGSDLWSGDANNGVYDASTGEKGASVQATNAVRLVIKTPEEADTVDEVQAPTDTTTQNTDTDDDETDVGDTETEAPDKEENPKTGVALAVIPMLVAAAAAVVAKKH